MEKATKTKTRTRSILKMIPKAAQAAAVSFQNLPFSPRRDKRPDHGGVNAQSKHKSHLNKGVGFSGPIMIPPEARGRWKNSETPEPSSPKVSCIGQIKYKRSLSKKKQHDSRSSKEFTTKHAGQSKKKTKEIVSVPAPASDLRRKRSSGIMKVFSAGRKSDAAIEHMRTRPPTSGVSPPRLSQMRKFASSRDTLSGFDWSAAQITPEEEHDGGSEFYSDGERECSDGEDDIIIPFSAPIPMRPAGAGVDLEPRKEINLWKRRTMARPKPLQLN